MLLNSTYRNALTTAVLQLQETGRLDKLKTRWWKEKGGGTCMASTTNAAGQLTIKHVGGVFLVLGLGTALACVFTLIELLYDVTRTSRSEKVPFSQVMMEELRFIARCHGSTRPVRKYDRSSSSNDGFDLALDRPDEGDYQPDGIKERIT